MFGDIILCGKSIKKLDDRNRIILPKEVNTEKDEPLVYVNKDNKYLKLYSYRKLKEELIELDRSRKTATSIDEYNYYCELIEKLTDDMLDIKTVDLQRRIVIPKKMAKEFNICDQVVIVGHYDHIDIYDSEETLKECKKRY